MYLYLLGLQYIDIIEGNGKMPQIGDYVNVHHKGRFLNGKKIPNADSYIIGVPLTFKVGLGYFYY